ncbi:SDR family oxidoreductase [Amycolatopsis carbonis]|uniref:SDR family oxidoreductase n=1 Tax=Amycolatopsis carbonis TaxID=715471 RepID=A0A9Y2IN10_9PSEU|nr:SDR family oxidoreductase [Amycolatopsis sp. 2-15]WIX82817.1 SDR family oxidoreductase [Amycolatopsis sp. 2-15]
MDFTKTVAVVTGGNRGLGLRFAEQLIERGAKVYAAARRPEAVELAGAVPLRLDLTDQASIGEAAALASDATFLINNAGISTHTALIDGSFDNIRLEMETHYFGTLAATRAFAPVIERNGGGAVLNILSVLSWVHVSAYGAYCAAKSASWAMSNVLREELRPKGIHVASLHVGYMATDMADYVAPEDKVDPAAVAKAGLDGVAAGANEIIADEKSRRAKENLGVAL